MKSIIKTILMFCFCLCLICLAACKNSDAAAGGGKADNSYAENNSLNQDDNGELSEDTLGENLDGAIYLPEIP